MERRRGRGGEGRGGEKGMRKGREDERSSVGERWIG